MLQSIAKITSSSPGDKIMNIRDRKIHTPNLTLRKTRIAARATIREIKVTLNRGVLEEKIPDLSNLPLSRNFCPSSLTKSMRTPMVAGQTVA